MKVAPKALQDREELDLFVDLVRRERVTSYLEIGSKYGGSLWPVANALPYGSRVVSVDWPNADKLMKESLSELRVCVGELRNLGYDAHLIVGDSRSREIVGRVRSLSPFDLCLIDGGHDEQCVRSDWDNYGPMAKIVAFHDVSWPIDRPTQPQGLYCHVQKIWREVKAKNCTLEIVKTEGQLGFGVLWHAAEV